jgi:hypothetical protein
MPSKVRQQKNKATAAAADKPTQKRALAEALRQLGPNAGHAALVGFVRKQFGMELTVCIMMPKQCNDPR